METIRTRKSSLSNMDAKLLPNVILEMNDNKGHIDHVFVEEMQ